MSGRDLIKKLGRNGWVLDRIVGSHHIMVKDSRMLSVPVHGNHDIPTGTLSKLLKEAGLK
jgi:predicted RNA binding protein YcfA (HicA-like mRNA interferase family)